MDVFGQRLDQEFDAPVVLTSPSVAYKVKIKGQKNIKAYGEYMYVRSAFKLPERGIIERMDEPMIKVVVFYCFPLFGFRLTFCYSLGHHHGAQRVHRSAGRADTRAKRR